ncbi:trehalose-phosphatase [Mycobacterium sp. MBM]|nr:trehalose-phosphatase [Mycobacterium sp. MBM]
MPHRHQDGGCGTRVVIDPRYHDGVLFDLDGVVTDTAALHHRAWAALFDGFLADRPPGPNEDHRPFTHEDYRRHVDGKPRTDGIRDFLTARGIALPRGDDSERLLADLAARKQDLYLRQLDGGVSAIDSTLALVRRLNDVGIATAVYSSSKNCARVLRAAGIADVFTVRVDGETTETLGLPGKPHPALLLETARRLGVRPDRCVVIDDATPGTQAGRAGGFALVVGIARYGNGAALTAAGADVAVCDAADIDVRTGDRRVSALPDALACLAQIVPVLAGRHTAVFIDFDGTLTDTVADPADAALITGAAEALRALSARCPVVIVSGRALPDVRARVGVDGLWYAGSDGLDLAGPDGQVHRHDLATAATQQLAGAATELGSSVGDIHGVVLQDRPFGVAVHYRNVAPADITKVVSGVRAVGRRRGLRVIHGREMVGLRPDMLWDRGAAVTWISAALPLPTTFVPMYLGDDLTDEDGFDAVKLHGIGILARHDEDGERSSAAHFTLSAPNRAVVLLARLAHLLPAESATDKGDWRIEFECYQPNSERLREVLCTVGNGYLGTRGAAPESAPGPAHYPGTYAAGLYNRVTDTVGGIGVSNESMVNLPNWLPLTFRPEGGQWFDVDDCELLAYRQTMDTGNAELIRELRYRDETGRQTAVTQRRFVSMHDPHTAALRTDIVAENWSGTIEIRSTIDATVTNCGVQRYRPLSGKHLCDIAVDELSDRAVLVRARTTQSQVPVAVAARTSIWHAECPVHGGSEFLSDPSAAGHIVTTGIDAGRALTVEKVAAIFTGHDRALSAPEEAAAQLVSDRGRYRDLFDDHALVWSQLWRSFDIDLPGSPESLRILRLHIMHLLQSVSSHSANIDAGIPARGLHGEAYRGHIFWDELFIVPLLTLRLPQVSRALLGYRSRRLDQARRNAVAAGYSGAMYPWQSSSDGSEQSQRLHLNPLSGRWNPDSSHLAHHIGAAVAYNVWHYYQITGDRQYLLDHGAEVLIEIARFWSSRVRFDTDRQRYVIDGVIGPDEFHSGYPGRPHEGIDNNAYTNVTAVWVILRALDALDALPLPDRVNLLERLKVSGNEMAQWDSVSRYMFIPFHDGVISQFEGYEDLKELDWEHYRHKYGDIARLDRILEAENDDVNAYKVAKQADVLMLFYLFSADELRELFARLGYDFPPQQIPRTVDYYLNRTSHGSTLSAVVHSWVLARGDRGEAMRYFQTVLDSDVTDIQGGSTAEGIHLAAMAGSIDLLQRCFSGLETREDRLVLGPMWPESAGELACSLWYRGHRLHLRISGRTAEVTADPTGAPTIDVECRGRIQRLSSGQTIHIR